MSAKEAVKKNLSSMQVLKTLQLLLEDNYTMSDLIERLNKNEQEPVFNNSVVSKYINTCRFCGIEIPKIHNKYYVSSLPFGLNMSSGDLDLLSRLQYSAKVILSNRQMKIFDEFITKLSKFSNKHIIRVEEKTTKSVYKMFNEAVEEKRIIELMFRAKNILECLPIEIIERKGQPHFHVLYKNKDRYIAVKRISGLKVLDEKFIAENPETVVFELTGPLKNNYTLKEGEETTITGNPDCIAITNSCYDKEKLLLRLLRYGENCKIIKPLHYREEMKSLLDKMLKNYGV